MSSVIRAFLPSGIPLPAALGSTDITPLFGYYGGSDCCAVPLSRVPASTALNGPPRKLPRILSPTTPNSPALPFNEVCRVGRSRLSPQASPFIRRLATVTGRIGFTFVWVCGSASGCSPPRLTTTQLPPAALPLLVSEGLRLSLVVFMVTSFARISAPSAPFSNLTHF
jgi:hypothetical protein